MSAWHTYPNRDLIGHDTETDNCVCGPTVEHVPTPDGDSWLYTHHSLDGREIKESR